MKVTELKKVIREEVKQAIREEIQEMLTEAVKIASAPEKPVVETKAPSKPQPKQSNLNFGAGYLDAMLNETRASMTGEDYQNVVSMDSSMVSKPNFASSIANQTGLSSADPGLDISQLDFVSKAKSVLDAANQKDKARHGL